MKRKRIAPTPETVWNWDGSVMPEIARRLGMAGEEKTRSLFFSNISSLGAWAHGSFSPPPKEIAAIAAGIASDSFALADKLHAVYGETFGVWMQKWAEIHLMVELPEGEEEPPEPRNRPHLPDLEKIGNEIRSIGKVWDAIAKEQAEIAKGMPKKPRRDALREAIEGLIEVFLLEMGDRGIHPAMAKRKLPTLVWLALRGARVPLPGKTPFEQKKRLREQYFPKNIDAENPSLYRFGRCSSSGK